MALLSGLKIISSRVRFGLIVSTNGKARDVLPTSSGTSDGVDLFVFATFFDFVGVGGEVVVRFAVLLITTPEKRQSLVILK
jgi:hypothetical protein